MAAGDGAAALYGGDGADTLTGGDTAAYLDGGIGNDVISGGDGAEVLEGGEHKDANSAGNDHLDGGGGNDTLRGGYGADTLIGGTGDDLIDHLGHTEERLIIEQRSFAWRSDGAADVLIGGEGNDTLVFDANDTASGGAGNDVFHLYFDAGGGSSVAEVTDFKLGEDFLRVTLNPRIGENDAPNIEVTASDDGEDGLVIVNGDLVAVLRGAPGATASDVYAEVLPDL